MKKKRNAKNKGIYAEAFKYLIEIKAYLLFTVILFFASVVLGILFYEQLGFLDDLLKKMVEDVKDLKGFEMFFYILQNNLQSALSSVLIGVFFGVVPVFSAISNGVVLGYVLLKASLIEGYGVVFQLLPHGIFELPAIFVAIALGISLGFALVLNYFEYYSRKGMQSMVVLGIFLLPFTILFSFIFNRKLRKIQLIDLKHRFFGSMMVFFSIVMPLLILAAIIESLLIAFLG